MKRSSRMRLMLVVAGFVGGAVGAILYFREPTEPLTRPAIDAARRKWSEAGIRDYSLRYRMHGSQYEVSVGGGIVSEVRVNGVAPNSSDWRSYGVEGLFDVLSRELELAQSEDSAQSSGAVMRRVRFNPALGYVERYIRSGGSAKGASIELLEFRRR